eukprot:COSAG05_NODE_3881_length_1792_cov_24.680063_1_plen_21_part_10
MKLRRKGNGESEWLYLPRTSG